MDSNTDSSEDEEKYILASEPCKDDSNVLAPDDDSDDGSWFDACLEPQSVSTETSHVNETVCIDQNREISMNLSPSPDNQENPGRSQEQSEQDVKHSSSGTVIETDIDSGQERYITQIKPVKDESSRMSSDEVSITFHALVSSDIDFQAETDRVSLHIWDSVCSSKKIVAEEMKFVCYRHDAKNAAEITGTITLKKTLLRHISHRYLVEKTGLDPATNMPRNSLWEKVYTDSKFERRKLYLPLQKNFQGGQYHQYDGYIYQNVQRGLWKTVIDFISSTADEDAGLVTRVFAQDIAKTLLRDVPTSDDISQAVVMSTCLKTCIERTYKIYSNLVTEAILGEYCNMLQALVKINDDLTIQRKMAMCVLLLQLRQLVDSKVNNLSVELICRSFLLNVDRKNKTVVEWIYVNNYLNNRDRECLKEGLILLALDIANSYYDGKNPSWFYLVPMIHFLDGACQPFQEVTLDKNHRDEQPKWWGISDKLGKVIEKFQWVFGTWKIPLRQVCDNMQHMFEVDFYLPRTMLAGLFLQELKDALDSQVFPPEICCASICYFIYISPRQSNAEYAQIEKCVSSLLLQTLKTRLHGENG